jgi:large subunit ribosomal protein L33
LVPGSAKDFSESRRSAVPIPWRRGRNPYHFRFKVPWKSHTEAIMAKGKEARGLIKLQSSESSHVYFTQKNRNNTKERISLKKYDPTLRKRVLYKEAGKL